MTRKKTTLDAGKPRAESDKIDKATDFSTESAKHPGGRPSEYEGIDLEQVRFLMEKKGFTDQDLADFYGKSRTTITNWKAAHPEFLATINIGKDVADGRVERSLFERACGYTHPDVHIAVIEGAVVQTPITKYYPPDPASMIFWLKNRKPGTWRDKTEVQDDRLTELLKYMHRNKEESHAQENRQPPANPGKSRRGR